MLREYGEYSSRTQYTNNDTLFSFLNVKSLTVFYLYPLFLRSTITVVYSLSHKLRMWIMPIPKAQEGNIISSKRLTVFIHICNNLIIHAILGVCYILEM